MTTSQVSTPLKTGCFKESESQPQESQPQPPSQQPTPTMYYVQGMIVSEAFYIKYMNSIQEDVSKVTKLNNNTSNNIINGYLVNGIE